MKDKKSEIKLGGIFYPQNDISGNPIDFDSLYLPYIWREIYFEGVYIDSFNTKSDMVVLDIGSQVGLTVQHFRPYCKKLVAVEPATESFTALKKNKEFNNWDNVELVNAAIADKDGEMFLSTFSPNRTCHSLTKDYGQGGEMVKTVCFETLFKEHDIDEVDFCKFDVEGAEYMILLGESFAKVASKVKQIMVEFHDAEFPRIVEHMQGLGFKARRYDSSAIIILFYR